MCVFYFVIGVIVLLLHLLLLLLLPLDNLFEHVYLSEEDLEDGLVVEGTEQGLTFYSKDGTLHACLLLQPDELLKISFTKLSVQANKGVPAKTSLFCSGPPPVLTDVVVQPTRLLSYVSPDAHFFSFLVNRVSTSVSLAQLEASLDVVFWITEQICTIVGLYVSLLLIIYLLNVFKGYYVSHFWVRKLEQLGEVKFVPFFFL